MIRAVIAGMFVAATAWSAEPAMRSGVTVTKGTMSADLTDAPLSAVIESIAAQTGITVSVSGRAEPRSVTAHFAQVPFAEGLERLLRGVPGTLVVRDAAHGYAGISAVIIIEARGDEVTRATPPATIEDVRQLVDTLPRAAVPDDVRQAMIDATHPPDPALAASVRTRRAEALNTLIDRLESTPNLHRQVVESLRRQAGGARQERPISNP